MPQKYLLAWERIISCPNTDQQMVWLHTDDCYMAIRANRLLYCETCKQPRDYTNIWFTHPDTDLITTITSSHPIGQWEALLAQYGFCRIHRNCLVNYSHLTRIWMKQSLAEMKVAGRTFTISRTGRKKLQDRMQGKTV